MTLIPMSTPTGCNNKDQPYGDYVAIADFIQLPQVSLD